LLMRAVKCGGVVRTDRAVYSGRLLHTTGII